MIQLTFNQTHCGAIQRLVKRKLTAQQEFTDALKSIAEDERNLAKELLAKAPENLREFLVGAGIIGSLLAHGHSNNKINLTEVGFTGYSDAFGRLSELQKAWDMVVTVVIAPREEHESTGRLELKFQMFQM